MSYKELRLKDEDAEFWKDVLTSLFHGQLVVIGEFYKRAGSRPKVKTGLRIQDIRILGDTDARSLSIETREGLYTGCVLFEIHPDERSVHVINRDDRDDEYWWTFTLFDPEGLAWKKFRKAEEASFMRGDPLRVEV